MMNCGIYCLTFPNGKFYIGSSCVIKKRTRIHECELESGRHKNGRLQKAYNKYKLMEKKTLLVCSRDELKFYEQLIIDGLKPPLNISRNAYRPEMTPEVCAKIAEAARGRLVSDETRRKMSQSRKGRKLSDELKARLSALAQGRKNSTETREKMSQAKKGKKLSEAHRAARSDIQIKKWAKWRADNGREMSSRHIRYLKAKAAAASSGELNDRVQS